MDKISKSNRRRFLRGGAAVFNYARRRTALAKAVPPEAELKVKGTTPELIAYGERSKFVTLPDLRCLWPSAIRRMLSG